MAKGYEDLSRRGLIELNKDFDVENDGALMKFLAENGDNYEDIRPIESIIDRVDQVAETVSNAGYKIKSVIGKEGGNLLESVIGAIADAADIVTGDFSIS